MPKINLKDKVNDNELDLSMCDIQDVPVKNIAAIKRVTIVDLSNNKIISLPDTFATSLARLVKLDLSQNNLQTLPDNFGELKNLRELDLYNNKLQHLPLSLGQCKFLKWLDLKNNPLVPAINEIAGPCLDSKQCQSCAKKIVSFLTNMQVQLDKEVERRNAQRKRDLDIREAQQLQNKKGQQKNTKKATKAEKKQKDSEDTQISSSVKMNAGSTQNGRIKETYSKKKSFLSLIFFSLLTVSFVSFLAGFLLHKYDKPKFAIALGYIENAWNSTKTLFELDEELNKGTGESISKTRHILLNIRSAYNFTATKVFDFYSIYLTEQNFSEIGRVIYDAFNYIFKLIVNFVNKFIEDLPEIIDVIQKRLLG